MTTWRCPHGMGPESKRGDCESCEADLVSRPAAEAMTGDERYAEVMALLHEPSAFGFHGVHKRIEELVGRPVWTHEFVQDLALAIEAKSWEHPADLGAHVIRTAEAAADGKLVIVVGSSDD